MYSNSGINLSGIQAGGNLTVGDITNNVNNYFPNPTEKKDFSSELETYFSVKCGQDPELVGKDQDLKDLRHLLEKHHAVRIVGRAGSGKTSLAIRYVLDDEHLYKYKLWFDAESRDSFDRSIEKIISIMGITDTDGKTNDVLFSKIYAAIENSTAVIIFDNAVKSFNVSDYVPSKRHGFKTLITSQIRTDSKFETLEIKVLDDECGIELIKQKAKSDFLHNYEDKLRALVNKLQGLPLEYLHVAAVIRNTPRDRLNFILDDYMQNLDQYMDIPLDEDEDKPVIHIISRTLTEIAKSNCDRKMVDKMLLVLSYVNPSNIEPQLFYDMNFDKKSIDSSLLLLEKYSILSRIRKDIDKFSIHRLVQVTIRINRSNYRSGQKWLWLKRKILGSEGNVIYTRFLKLMLNREYLYSGHHDNVFTHLHGDLNVRSFFTKLSEEEKDNFINSLAKHGLIKNLQELKNQSNAKNVIRKGIALVPASQNGHFECVKFLVSNGASVNSKNHLGHTALMASCFGGHVRVVKFLLDNGADVHAPEPDGRTAILYAFQNGNKEIIRLLEAKGADVHVETSWKTNGLHFAAYQGHLDIVEELVTRRSFDVNSRQQDGTTPLMESCARGHLRVVQFLLDNQADVHATDQYGQTAILQAFQNGNKEIIRLLEAKGADIHAENENKINVLHLAVYQGYFDIVEELVARRSFDVNSRRFDGRTPLMDSCLEGHVRIVKFLLDNRADVHATDQYGQTAILYAFQNGNKEIIRLLEAKGADVHAENEKKINGLHLAVYHGHLDIVEELVARRSFDVNSRRLDGRTPLMESCVGGQVHIAQFLLDNRADVHASNQDDWTPILFAFLNGNKEIIRLLEAKGADVHVEAQGKINCLHLAAAGGHYDLVEELVVRRSFDVNSRTSDGQTPLTISCFGGHVRVVQFLLDNRADVHASDSDGRTVMQYAFQNGNKEIVRLLETKGARKK